MERKDGEVDPFDPLEIETDVGGHSRWSAKELEMRLDD